MKSSLPSLPRFDVPNVTSKPLSFEEFYLLNTEWRRQLARENRLHSLSSAKSRVPADKAFRI